MRRSTKKRIVQRIRRPFEWIGIALGFAVFSMLPRRVLFAASDFASSVMYFFDRKGRALALDNLRIVFGRDVPGADKIVRRSYRNMGRTGAYAFWTCFRAAKRAAATGEMSPEGSAFLKANRPAVTVSAHVGCWEILSQLAFLEGHRMVSVAKDIGSSAMTALLMKARRSIGQEIVRADGAFRPLMQAIRDGKSLGLLVDQVVKPKNGGVWVRFFGRPVPVSAAPAFFAAKGKAPVVVAWSRPLKDGRYRCEVVRTYAPEAARDIWGFTQGCIHDLERVIRRHPSCWVLNYRYFRKTPTKEDLALLDSREAQQVVGTAF